MTTKTVQFTPGPWVMRPDSTIESKDGVTVASFIDNKADMPLIAAAPVMYDALQNLLEWAKGNRGVKEGNPYCKPEVRQALKVLASIQGKKDYLDADTASQAEGRQA